MHRRRQRWESDRRSWLESLGNELEMFTEVLETSLKHPDFSSTRLAHGLMDAVEADQNAASDRERQSSGKPGKTEQRAGQEA